MTRSRDYLSLSFPANETNTRIFSQSHTAPFCEYAAQIYFRQRCRRNHQQHHPSDSQGRATANRDWYALYNDDLSCDADSSKGCQACKARRVKCDEGKPICKNCARRSTPCSFTSNTPHASSPAPGSRTGATNRQLQGPAPRPQHIATLGPQRTATYTFDLFDLELWHHWLATVCYTFTDSPAGVSIWQDQMPRLVTQHEFAAQLLLALSALHLARTDEQRKQACIAKSNALQADAITGITALLAGAAAADTEALYVAAMLLCFCNFGQGPQPGQYLIFADNGQPKWLGLLQDIKSMMINHPDALPTLTALDKSKAIAINAEEKIDGVTTAFQELRASIDAFRAEDSSSEKYVDPLNELEKCFSRVFERFLEPEPGDPQQGFCLRSHQIFAWLYRLEADYIVSAQEKRPMALVLLAHYLVLLSEFKTSWYIEGWALHIMEGIKRNLHSAYSRSLSWPCQHVS